ncbi:MAG: hypothetical protein EOS43_27895 [Mesorhizobium sp.]|nr:MAG: hypothetical protein EOS43_27895 [Mesorhizobium sp.]TIS34660.1 MAG: hypothetical protein E5W95_29240 [Mesorhizobium sp.]
MRGAPVWRRRRSVQHPSTVSALRADPPSPTRGEGKARGGQREKCRQGLITPWPRRASARRS